MDGICVKLSMGSPHCGAGVDIIVLKSRAISRNPYMARRECYSIVRHADLPCILWCNQMLWAESNCNQNKPLRYSTGAANGEPVFVM